MDAILAQLLNGLDKGGAYALIALGLTLVFGTLGVVNFAHGALFMLGAFCAVTFRQLITLETVVIDPEQLSAWGAPLEIRTPLAQSWFGDFGAVLVDYSVPLSILLAIPVMLLIGIAMERGIIKHFYKRPACRADPRDLRPRHRAAGNRQGRLRPQPLEPADAPRACAAPPTSARSSASRPARSPIRSGA